MAKLQALEPSANNVLLDDDDLRRLGDLIGALTQGHSSVALASGNIALLQHHALALTQALREQGGVQLTIQPHTELDTLLKQFNALVAKLPVRDARKPPKANTPAQVWLMQSAEHYATETLQTLQRLVHDFPAVKLQMAFVYYGDVSRSPLAQWPNLWCWPIAPISAAQGQKLLARATELGWAGEAHAWLMRCGGLNDGPASPSADSDTTDGDAPARAFPWRIVAVGGALSSIVAMGAAWLHSAGPGPSTGDKTPTALSTPSPTTPPALMPDAASATAVPALAAPTSEGLPLAKPATPSGDSTTARVVLATPSPVPPPESKQPESKQPESKQPEPKQPEPKQPEPKQPEPKQPEPKQPEPKQPEPKKPEPKKPEPKQPETKQPETKQPETKQPEAKPQSTVNTSGISAAPAPLQATPLRALNSSEPSNANSTIAAIAAKAQDLTAFAIPAELNLTARDDAIMPLLIKDKRADARQDLAWVRALPDDRWLIEHARLASPEAAALWVGSHPGLNHVHLLKLGNTSDAGSYVLVTGPFTDQSAARDYAGQLVNVAPPVFRRGADLKRELEPPR